jgi:hypothetical protein
MGGKMRVRITPRPANGIVVRLLKDNEYGAAGAEVRVSITAAELLLERSEAEIAEPHNKIFE